MLGIGRNKKNKQKEMNSMKKHKICIMGLGYVGLPLAVEFAKIYRVIGFDINLNRISELQSGFDTTLEVKSKELTSVLVANRFDIKSKGLFLSSKLDDLADSNIFIITVPTPTDKFNRPQLMPLLNATKSVAKNLKKDDIVIYESTVYPGATEEECVPILEDISNLVYNKDFYVGYSPERINPGDKLRTLTKILKITSGSNPKSAIQIDDLYKEIIVAGTYMAPTIKVAEAAKVIENAQRDINIAFVNELSKIFNLLNIDTHSVLEAAATKWNFLPFKPGLVGGHCIGVDPHYIAAKAEQAGYHPEIILAGRRVNDTMGEYVAEQVIKLLIKKGLKLLKSKILILGITFKENCPDCRNTKVVDLIYKLKEFGVEITVYDPLADFLDVQKQYNLDITNKLPNDKFSAIVLAVNHSSFLGLDLGVFREKESIIYDVKGVLPLNITDLHRL